MSHIHKFTDYILSVLNIYYYVSFKNTLCPSVLVATLAKLSCLPVDQSLLRHHDLCGIMYIFHGVTSATLSSNNRNGVI